jgi:hypothetical protein
MTAASKSTFVIFGDQKKLQLLGRVNNQRYVVSFFSGKSAKINGYM